MSKSKLRLAFVSTIFLFPNDAGGKIRTTNILRGLKGGEFTITLVCPASSEQQSQWHTEIEQVCDEFVPWIPSKQLPKWFRAIHLLGELPVNIANDKTSSALAALRVFCQRDDIDLIVFDFVHAAVLMPSELKCKSVCFTHNVEAEIFARHAQQSASFLQRLMWQSQYKKMYRFEKNALNGFTSVIAVSERDEAYFKEHYKIKSARTIPTGVDLDFFSWAMPHKVDAITPPTVVFTGSMDWSANIDGIRYFLANIWPLVSLKIPEARFIVVGRNPPESLLAKAKFANNVKFTGFVDDVRPYVHDAHVFVIPLLVGGGTRIKAFEAMAMGCPMVSTSIGIEGLDIVNERHYLCADTAENFADAIISLLDDADLRETLSIRARQCVEQQFGHTVAAKQFETICLDALNN